MEPKADSRTTFVRPKGDGKKSELNNLDAEGLNGVNDEGDDAMKDAADQDSDLESRCPRDSDDELVNKEETPGPNEEHELEGEKTPRGGEDVIEEMDFKCIECGLSQEEATEESQEQRKVPSVRSPIMVSKAEREEHEKTHTPYRSWCKWCVWARSRNFPHKKKKAADEEDEHRGVPRVAMDYFFMSQEDEEASKNPCLVMKNEDSGDRYARAVGQKGVGSSGELDWLIKDISEELQCWGHAGGVGGKIIIKSDSENAMKALRTAVAKYHGGTVIPEAPAKGESQSNGEIEESGKTVREFVKILMGQLEEKAKV